MPSAQIVLEGEGAFTEQLITYGPKFVFVPETPLRIVRLEAGMVSQKSSVAIGFEAPDGNYYVVETSLALFRAAASAMATRDEMEGRPQ